MWAHFLSRANAQKVLFVKFIRALLLTTKSVLLARTASRIDKLACWISLQSEDSFLFCSSRESFATNFANLSGEGLFGILT